MDFKKSKFQISNFKVESYGTNAGFSIVEVIIVIAIFALVLTVFLNIFDWSNSNYFYQEAQVRASGSARQVMAEIESATLQGYRVVASQAVNSVTYSSDVDTLVLQIPSINGSGVVITNTWDYIVFYLSGSSLYKEVELGSGSARNATKKLLSDSVQSLTFTYNDPDFPDVTRIEADLRTAIVVRNLTARTRLQGQYYLRNH